MAALRVTLKHRLVFVYVYLALLPAGVEVLVHPPESVPVGYDMWAVLAASFLIDGAVLYRASNELATRAALTDVDLQQQGALSLPFLCPSCSLLHSLKAWGVFSCLDAAPRPGASASTLTKLRAIFKHINVTQVGAVALSLPTRCTVCAATFEDARVLWFGVHRTPSWPPYFWRISLPPWESSLLRAASGSPS